VRDFKGDYTVGAYPSAPSFHKGSREDESRFWRELGEMPLVGGIEQPCLEELHPLGDEFLLEHLAPHWHVVVTAIMGTMQRRQIDPHFGLASEREESRQAAVHFLAHVRDKVRKLNDAAGRAMVRAVELQAAPSPEIVVPGGAAQAFLRSLAEIAGWDWECPLVVEHCDSRDGVGPRKGFLSLGEEIAVVRALARDMPEKRLGLCVNWARSVLETRSVEMPLRHIVQCRDAGLMRGLMFSGTSPRGGYGEWSDLHVPFAPFVGARGGDADSLMTVEQACRCMAAVPAEALDFVGIKLLAIDPQADVETRLDILRDGVLALHLAGQ
jgi:hypothetical protein